MSERYPGGFVTKTPPTLNPALGNSTPGVWTLDQVMQNIKAGTWPAYDPYFEYTTLLLHGNGTNGAQNNTFLDSSTNNFTITRNGNTTQGTFTPYGSNWSNYLTGSSYLTWSGTSIGTSAFTFECWFFYTGTAFPPGGQDGASFIGPASASSGALNLNIVNSTTVSFDRYGVSADNFTVPTLVANTWYHIAFVRNASNVETVFLNGARSSTGTVTSSYNYTGTTNAVGFTGGAVSRYFPGYISNARLVTGSAVYDPTQTTITVPTAPLTAVSGTQLLTCQSNRFIDNSSNAFAITVTGSPSVQRFSPFNPSAPYAAGTIGGSGYFDGSGDYLTVADNAVLEPGSSNFTIEAWIYPTASAAHAGIVCHYGGSGAQAIAFDLATLTPQMNISSNGSTWDIASGVGSTAVSLYTWNHVAIVRNSNTFTIYVNGNSSGTATSSSSVANISSTWSIGTNTGTGSEPLTGYISNARVVIGTAVYTANFTPPTAPLTAIANTQLLCSFTNGGIIDNAMMNDLETVGNAQISTTQSKFGGSSMYFDGSGDYLFLPQNQNTVLGSGNFTIEGWVYFNTATSSQEVFGLNINSNQSSYSAVRLVGNSGTWQILASNDGANWAVNSNAGTYVANTWYHFAYTRNGSTLYLYINGVQINSASISGSLYAGSYGSLLGDVYWTGGHYYLNGYIDDFRITKGIARYTANFTPQTSQWQDQ